LCLPKQRDQRASNNDVTPNKQTETNLDDGNPIWLIKDEQQMEPNFTMSRPVGLSKMDGKIKRPK